MIGNGRLWIGHCCTRYVLLKGRQQYHDHAKGLATIITHLIKGRLRLNSGMTVKQNGCTPDFLNEVLTAYRHADTYMITYENTVSSS
jgi:hypothetical protein